MNNIFALALLLFFSASSSARLNDQGQVIQDHKSVRCKGDDGTFSFTLNRSTGVIIFKDTQAMGRAQLPVGEPLAAEIDGNNIEINYHWEYTANYVFSATKRVRDWCSGDPIQILLNGDDADGSFFTNVSFECVVK